MTDQETSSVIPAKAGIQFLVNALAICSRSENSAVILDGQHRVAAFRYVDEQIRRKYEILVTFLVGIPFYQQAELFAIINGKQKPVNRSIIYDLFGYAPIGGDNEEQLYEGLMAVSRFCSHVTRILNRFPESPWQSKIKMRGPGDEGVISQAAVVEYLSALVEPKTLTKRLKVLPVLYSFFKESDPARCAALLILYLRAVQTALSEYWQNPKSLLWKNNGVAVMFRILHDDLMLAGGTNELMNSFRSIVARWEKAPQQDLKEPPKTGGGGVQNQLYDRFKEAMFSARELQQLTEMREHLEKNLIAIGGLVR
jgi:DGQHR domain-containing protein